VTAATSCLPRNQLILWSLGVEAEQRRISASHDLKFLWRNDPVNTHFLRLELVNISTKLHGELRIHRMHAVRSRALSLVPSLQQSRYPVARFVCGRRFPILPRTRSRLIGRAFHSSPSARSEPFDPPKSLPGISEPAATSPGHIETNSATNSARNSSDEAAEHPGAEVTGAEVAKLENTVDKAQKRGNGGSNGGESSPYGSAAKRSMRNRKAKELPGPELPQWWLQRSVRSSEELQEASSDLEVLSDGEPRRVGEIAQDGDVEPVEHTSKYQIDKEIVDEIEAAARAGLTIPTTEFVDGNMEHRSHLILQCPKDGGIYFLDALVDEVATTLNADVIRIDAQDIAEIGGDYIGDDANDAGKQSNMRSLAYEAQNIVAKPEAAEEAEEDAEDEYGEEEEYEDTDSIKPPQNPFGVPTLSNIKHISVGNIANLEKFIKSSIKVFPGNTNMSNDFSSGPFLPMNSGRSINGSSPENLTELKLSLLIRTLVDGSQIKRSVLRRQDGEAASADDISASDRPKNLIINIRDYKEIDSTTQGYRILDKLSEIVKARRKEGQHILIIGTVSSEELIPSLSKYAVKQLQSENDKMSWRTIFVPPVRTLQQDGIFVEDAARRIKEINIRHMKDAIRRRTNSENQVKALYEPLEWDLRGSPELLSSLEESVWRFDRVHRLAMLAIGEAAGKDTLEPEDIVSAAKKLEASDKVKYRWMAEAKREWNVNEVPSEGSSIAPTKVDPEERMKRLRKTCNTHEKKLLNGVINIGMSPPFMHTLYVLC
jgi:hypothetical protein